MTLCKENAYKKLKSSMIIGLFVMRWNMKKTLIVLIVVAMVLLVGCEDYEALRKAVDPSDVNQVVFTVPSGATTTSIGESLEKDGLIQSAKAFKIEAINSGKDGKLQAGDYQVSRSMDVMAILTKMSVGDTYVETDTFTIPEGFEVKDIVARLVNLELVDEDVFNNVLTSYEFDYRFLDGIDRSNRLEGFLYPDTYEIRKGASEVEIVTLMLERFDDVFEGKYYARAEALGMSLEQVITLASVIEREAKLDEERTTVSSVFHNRINIEMPLQSCATVQYILGERKPVLSNADTLIESPYNTYINAGLPPAPIASPGKPSIVAALYPEDTEFLFFRTSDKNDGSHVFTTNFTDHQNANKKGN